MTVEIGIPVLVCPGILNTVVEPVNKVPVMPQTMIVEIPMIVEVGVSVVRSPMILGILVLPMSKVPAVT
jgi:hypothetical protein